MVGEVQVHHVAGADAVHVGETICHRDHPVAIPVMNIDEPTMRGFVVPIEKSIAGWVVTNRKSVRIDDAHQGQRRAEPVAGGLSCSMWNVGLRRSSPPAS